MADRKSRNDMPTVSGTTGVGEPCTVETIRRDDGVIASTVSGAANATCLSRIRYQLMNELDDRPTLWLLDVLKLEKFERDAVDPFIEILKGFKERGGVRAVAVVSDSGVRMMLASVSMQSVPSGGIALELVASLDIAHMRLGSPVEEAQ